MHNVATANSNTHNCGTADSVVACTCSVSIVLCIVLNINLTSVLFVCCVEQCVSWSMHSTLIK
jgi:hypothetical protein